MTALVLLHALPFDPTMWCRQIGELSARGHLVVAPYQRGFGHVPLGSAGPSLDVVADDLAGLLDRRGIGRAVLVGLSLGGYVAMAFLRRHPARVAGLALASTRATADDPGDRARREHFATRIVDARSREALLSVTTPSLVGVTTRTHRPAVMAFVEAAVRAAPPESVAWTQRAIARRPDNCDLLRRADVPAVVVAGAEDELVAPGESAALARLLPRGRLVTIEGAGHLTALEDPAAFSEAVSALVDEVRPVGVG